MLAVGEALREYELRRAEMVNTAAFGKVTEAARTTLTSAALALAEALSAAKRDGTKQITLL